jgi:hypothetical protein
MPVGVCFSLFPFTQDALRDPGYVVKPFRSIEEVQTLHG